MIRNNLLDRVVVGGMDSLTPFSINCFSFLMIYDDESIKNIILQNNLQRFDYSMLVN